LPLLHTTLAPGGITTVVLAGGEDPPPKLELQAVRSPATLNAASRAATCCRELGNTWALRFVIDEAANDQCGPGFPSDTDLLQNWRRIDFRPQLGHRMGLQAPMMA